MQKFGKFATAVLAATVLAFTGVVSFAAGQFEGTWKVTDTAGKAFEIKLGSDGSASAARARFSRNAFQADIAAFEPGHD